MPLCQHEGGCTLGVDHRSLPARLGKGRCLWHSFQNLAGLSSFCQHATGYNRLLETFKTMNPEARNQAFSLELFTIVTIRNDNLNAS